MSNENWKEAYLDMEKKYIIERDELRKFKAAYTLLHSMNDYLYYTTQGTMRGYPTAGEWMMIMNKSRSISLTVEGIFK